MDGEVIDPQEEVKKLQDLVRKLELQNQQLRRKQRNSRETTPVSLSENCLAENEDCGGGGEIPTDCNRNHSILDEVELIDVNQFDLSDEDSWLYSSPESVGFGKEAISPYKWLRLDVEDPNNRELQSAKRALVSKIENLSRVSNLHSSPQLSLQRTYNLSNHDSYENCFGTHSIAKLSLTANTRREIDSRTFTRPKKSLIGVELPVVDGDGKDRNHRSRRTSTPPLPDVSDIHTIARLQEECLRQSSPPSTPRRSSVASSSSQRSGVSPVTSLDLYTPDSFANMTPITGGTGSPKALSSKASSASESPSVSPHSSQYFDESKVSGHGIIKRSLPNLPRPSYNGTYSPRGSTANLGSDHQRAFSNCDHLPKSNQVLRNQRYSMSPSRQPSNVPRSLSPATRVLSVPSRKSPPIEESKGGGITSRIPKPRTRSAIPMRASFGKVSTSEESWKDGCY